MNEKCDSLCGNGLDEFVSCVRDMNHSGPHEDGRGHVWKDRQK